MHEWGAALSSHLWSEGQQSLHDWVGRYEGHELGVDHLHLVHLLGHKACVQLVRDGLSLLCGGGCAQIVGGCAVFTISTIRGSTGRDLVTAAGCGYAVRCYTSHTVICTQSADAWRALS